MFLYYIKTIKKFFIGAKKFTGNTKILFKYLTFSKNKKPFNFLNGLI